MLTRTKKHTVGLGRCLLASLLAGLWVFFATQGTFPWLTPMVCNVAIVLTFVFVFAFPRVGASDAHSAERKPPPRLPRSGLLAFLLAQGSLLLALGLLMYLLMLNPEDSSRAAGIPLESYNPRSPGMVLALLIGLSVLGVGALSWRDWRKRMPEERSWQRGTLGVLIVSGLAWVFLIIGFCVPSIFLDIVG